MARDRTIDNDIVSDVVTPVRPRRMEVFSGVERRRKWSDETRIAIVAEALTPGVVVSHIARRHDINPSQLFGWMAKYRAEAMAQRSAKLDAVPPTFATAVLDLSAAKAEGAAPLSPEPGHAPASIEINIGPATVRIRGAVDANTLALVLKALRVLS